MSADGLQPRTINSRLHSITTIGICWIGNDKRFWELQSTASARLRSQQIRLNTTDDLFWNC
ncbi:hypothetical protein GXM_04914 [Nostoc sphaeroides CCNUC1]|uniref:Uncharacterized protein n=1 Tax=Nostoc sphaeroides CCNUC1 TaxID=2653204 RepID=A0A5P8W429_9NOSO|nr:hypothetical protein GXM_04914 [Nostoc sphaeroides CCNUC1]